MNALDQSQRPTNLPLTFVREKLKSVNALSLPISGGSTPLLRRAGSEGGRKEKLESASAQSGGLSKAGAD